MKLKRIVSFVLALAALPALAQELPALPGGTPTSLEAKLKALQAKRVKPVPPTTLPGLGVMPGKGDPEDLKPQVVRVSEDKTAVINVSGTLTNRISTPFPAPKAIDNQSKDFDISQVGQSLYVTMKTANPVSLYVTGTHPNDPVISLTLLPKQMPAQTVTLQLDKPLAGVNPDGTTDDKAPDSNVYTDQIRYVLREIALGKTPDGFSEGDLPRAVARIGQVMAYPLSRYSGPDYDVFRYRIEAIADNVELDEAAFYQAGVRAVAFFPNATLHRGESTEVYVVSDKTESN